MSAIYIQKGDAIDYTPETAKAAGDIVAFGGGIGVVKEPIAAGALGALELCGKVEQVVYFCGSEVEQLEEAAVP